MKTTIELALAMACLAFAVVPAHATQDSNSDINFGGGTIIYNSGTSTFTTDIFIYIKDPTLRTSTTFSIAVKKNGTTLVTLTPTFNIENASSDCAGASSPGCAGGCGRNQDAPPGQGYLVCQNSGGCTCLGSQRPTPVQISVASSDVISFVIDPSDAFNEWSESDNTSSLTIP